MSLVLARLDAELAVWLLALLVGFTVLAGLVLAEIRATEDDEPLDQLAAGAEPQPGDELERWLGLLRSRGELHPNDLPVPVLLADWDEHELPPT